MLRRPSPWLVAVSLLSLAPLAQAGSLPAAAPAEPTQEAADPSAERPRERVLHLADGRVLRGRTRSEDGRWALEVRGEWVPVDGVARAVDERELRDEARRRLTRLRRDDLAGRAEHARWLAEEGLFPESLELLDRVLDADADQPEALAVLRERPPRVALPDATGDRDAFYAHVGRTGPAFRELALQALMRVEDRAGLSAELRAELRHGSRARREVAALALRRLFPGEHGRSLVISAVLDPAQDVRAEASRALRDAQEAELAVEVISALGSSHGVVRKHAAEALGTMNATFAVPALVSTLQSSSGYRPPASHIFVGRQIAYIQDFDVEVAQFEAIADPSINVLTEGAVLDARVLGASGGPSTLVSSAAERGAIYDSLASLTGADVPRSPRAWQSWLDDQGPDSPFVARAPE